MTSEALSGKAFFILRRRYTVGLEKGSVKGSVVSEARHEGNIG